MSDNEGYTGMDANASGAVSPGENDAFAPDNIGVVHFITQSRILDTLYAIHRHMAPNEHAELLEAHAQGLLLGPSPTFQGLFLTDEINKPAN